MDFDLSKENIQPLRQGRRADRLEFALGNEKELIDQERKQHEALIESTKDSADPLAAWYEYICWIEQTYVKSGSESGLDQAVRRCLCLYEDDARYKQDRRLIKLFIKYIDTQDNPLDIYKQLWLRGIGTMVADLYIGWSHYYDAADDFKQTELIFRRGLDAGAQPYDELAQAHHQFSISMSQRLLYNDDESRKKHKETMEEKRSALTHLRAHKKRTVGSVRTGFAVLNENPGRYEAMGSEPSGNPRQVRVHEDDGNEPEFSGSIMKRAIVEESKKKNENFLEPGPWSKVKMKTGTVSKVKAPGFEIMEDDDFQPIPCKNKLYERGAQLPEGFIRRNEPQRQNDGYAMILEEPVLPNVIPCYEKFSIYPNAQTEISPEELKGFRWFVKRKIFDAPVVEKYAELLINKFENGPRLYPGFPTSNVSTPEEKYATELEPHVVSNIQLPIEKMYEGNFETKSMEELLADKFNRGEINLLKSDDFEEDLSAADMELTRVYEGRQSVYPLSRKSFVPRKSIMRKSVMAKAVIDEDEEEEEKVEEKPRVVRFEDERVVKSPDVKEENDDNEARMSLKRKLETPVKDTESKAPFIGATPPAMQQVPKIVDTFKPPLPPVQQETRKSIRFDRDEDETICSTMQFNCLIKAESMSTPNNSKKAVPRLVPIQPIPLQESPEKSSPPQESKIMSPPEQQESPDSNQQTQQPAPKQLSTIMEVTETTQSTKSTFESSLHPKTPISSRVVREVENEKSVNPFEIFRIPEEQTEPFARSMQLPRPAEIVSNMSIQRPLPTMQGVGDFSQIQIPKLDDDFAMFDMKSPKIEIPKEPLMIMPPPTDESHMEIPATQEISHMEFPPTQEVPKQAPFAIFEDSILAVPPPKMAQEESHMEIPATQEMEASHVEIPATQEIPQQAAPFAIFEDSVCPPPKVETQDFPEFPATQEIPIEKPPSSAPFMIYEDSICLPPAPIPKEPQPFVPAIVNESKMMHASYKENLPIMPNPIRRVASDELLSLCASPLAGMKSGSGKTKDEMSDFLKFSGCASVENSMKELHLNAPSPKKSASPTMPIFDEDLNTERFKFPLAACDKNSTLIAIPQVNAKVEAKKQFELSIEYDEDEMEHVEEKQPTFKVPQIPVMKPPVVATTSKPVYVHNTTPFSIAEDRKDVEVEEEVDMSKTIYYENFEKKEVEEPENDYSDQMSWEDQAMCSFIQTDVNQYEHTMMHNESTDTKSELVKLAIEESNGNPFSENIRRLILEQCTFEIYLEDHVPNCKLLRNIPKLKVGTMLEVNSQEFRVTKFLAKGSFGNVYSVENTKTKEIFAAKQEKPSNLWEYYILTELFDRLKRYCIEHMCPAFMTINYAIIANNASVFISEYSPYGTIIDVCNKYRKVTGQNMDEYVGMVLATQLLSIIDFLHSCQIIHADIKPDNFLLMSKVELDMKVPALQLIDFGTAIDMEVYSKKDQFTYVVTTDKFTCCEMQEGKPWTYQTDLFGLAGTVHVLLFGKYMEVEKKIGSWGIKSRYPRYFKKELWTTFFDQLLNVPDCHTMPNLQELKQMILAEINERNERNYVTNKLAEFNKAINS